MVGFGRTWGILAPIVAGYLLAAGLTAKSLYIIFGLLFGIAGLCVLMLHRTFVGESDAMEDIPAAGPRRPDPYPAAETVAAGRLFPSGGNGFRLAIRCAARPRQRRPRGSRSDNARHRVGAVADRGIDTDRAALSVAVAYQHSDGTHAALGLSVVHRVALLAASGQVASQRGHRGGGQPK